MLPRLSRLDVKPEKLFTLGNNFYYLSERQRELILGNDALFKVKLKS